MIAAAGLRFSPWRARIDQAVRADRSSAALILVLSVAWLAYTRLYFWLDRDRGTVPQPKAVAIASPGTSPIAQPPGSW
jgi:hypothetical protein